MKIRLGLLRSLIRESLESVRGASHKIRAELAKHLGLAYDDKWMNWVVYDFSYSGYDPKSYISSMQLRVPDDRLGALATPWLEQNLEKIAQENGWFLNNRTKEDGVEYWNLVPIATRDLSRKRFGKTPVIGRYLWHITPVANVEEIMKNGLQPRRSTNTGLSGRAARNYPERIYLMASEEAAKELAGSMNMSPYALIKVDKKKIPGRKFYEDPEPFRLNPLYDFEKHKEQYSESVYTNEPIPADALSLVGIKRV